MATASCRRSTSTWCWNACPTPRATGSRSRCQANSCRINITTLAAMCRNMASRRGEAGHGPLPVIASEAKQSIAKKERVDCFVARAPRNDGGTGAIRPLHSRLHLLHSLHHQLVHLGADLRFRDGNAPGGEIGHHLADDGSGAAFAELGGDHHPGGVFGRLARDSELFGHPQSQKLVSARFGLELLLLVERELLLESFLTLVECGHDPGSDPCQRGEGHLVAVARLRA